MLAHNIIETYSKVHNPVTYTNDNEVSFDGSQIQFEFFSAWDKISEFYLKTKPKKLNFLEIGAWKGLWGIAFSEFCKLNNIEGSYLTLTMIDHNPDNQPLYKTIDYINSQDVKANLIDMNSLSEQALPEILKYSDSFNIVFIDAAHDYFNVKNDILAWYPKIKKGGFIGGHDYAGNFPGVNQAVEEIFGMLDSINGSWLYHKP